MLDKNKQKQITDFMQDTYTDLDIEKDVSFKFKSGKYMFHICAVPFIYHENFLKEMVWLISKYQSIFANIDFLASNNYTDKNEINKLLSQMFIFQSGKEYSHFIKSATKFVIKWGSISKINKKGLSKPKKNKRLNSKFIKNITPDTFIYILFLFFVRNYDIVKKNTLHFLQMFDLPSVKNTDTLMGTSYNTSKVEVQPMPKYSQSPYPESVLKIFEEQSKMH